MVYLPWLVMLLTPYWLGPSARPVFEPFTPGRHLVPEGVAASFRQTCDGLTTDGFRVVAELFQTGQMRHVSTRVARTVSVHNSPLLGSFTPPSRVVVRLPIVRDPARLVRVKRAYLDRYYRGVERVPFEHRDDPARFLGGAMGRELKEQVEAGTGWRDDRAAVFRPTFTSAWVMTWQALPPFSMLRRRRLRRRASAILEELNMASPDPRPIAQPRFFEKGFYLFRSEQHFGMAGHPDRVALFPRREFYRQDPARRTPSIGP